jgi:hypothetical protein
MIADTQAEACATEWRAEAHRRVKSAPTESITPKRYIGRFPPFVMVEFLLPNRSVSGYGILGAESPVARQAPGPQLDSIG